MLLASNSAIPTQEGPIRTMVPQEREHIHALSLLTLNPTQADQAVRHVAALSPEERETFLALADSNHVVLRALEPLRQAAVAGGDTALAQLAANALER